ncbi:hypothetical protein GCM10011578_068730 [Streptomyces fuscichromogenes]|uniref:Mutator family transposase n=1 Tax=Streptomyces fuscichromogenes TaxID=1324013 RepID=A0A917XIR9_9ACTN|nr:hypothetical protein GCM10011578_068730 [Streptomyces fuscichromogenes]
MGRSRLPVGDSGSEAFWKEFLRSLRERGLSGVRLVVTDQHAGWIVRTVMLGAAWQRCRVHFLRNIFGVIDRDSDEMAAETIRTIFTQPTAGLVRTQLDTVADMLGTQFPKFKAMLMEAKEDLTAFADFPPRHLKKIRSTNPLEPVNREIKRRMDVVQVLPQRRRAGPVGHRRALRDARRMDHLPPPPPPGRQHGRDLPRAPRKRPDTTQHPEHSRQLIPYTTARDTTRTLITARAGTTRVLPVQAGAGRQIGRAGA